ncbi:hypothetical protein VXN63_04890 [Marinilactibacillus sp. XAAS-LB27]|uniref:hypothetical protein n=1 Tax=Marinilactibacillus sp. XAAS-LB27 TaxID=3114538 RepID=UPI002E16D717|nr:hypothetical protein [Marinilactibacillus sp. XAAS-LB27]
MPFLLEVPAVIIIAVLHMIISFSLNVPTKYKTIFRIYSIVVSFSFVLFYVGFPMFFYDIISEQTVSRGFYFEGLALSYLLLSIPLIGTAVVLFGKWIMKQSHFSKLTKSIALIAPSILLIAIGIMGYYPFMLFFYGFN